MGDKTRRIDGVGSRGKDRVYPVCCSQGAVGQQLARVLVQVFSWAKLQRIDKDGQDHTLGLLAGDFNQ